jgi:signal transduction histidine kinase
MKRPGLQSQNQKRKNPSVVKKWILLCHCFWKEKGASDFTWARWRANGALTLLFLPDPERGNGAGRKGERFGEANRVAAQGFTLAANEIGLILFLGRYLLGKGGFSAPLPARTAWFSMFKKRLSRAHEASFNRIVRRTFLLPMGVMVVASIALAWLVSHLLGLTNWVDHTDRVIAQARTCEKLAVDMETGLRGYLITGDSSFMQPFNQAQSQLSGELESLSHQVLDSPFQADRVEAIRTAYGQWISHAQEMLGRRERGEDYQSVALNAQGKAFMDTMRNEFASFVKDEYALRDQRINAVQRIDHTIRQSRWVVLLVLGLGIAWYVRMQLGQVAEIYDSALTATEMKTEALQASEASLREAEAKLRQYSADLERTVEQRTAKLQEMVTELEAYSYSISHDLRAPLRAMQGYAQVLLEDLPKKIGPEGKTYLERIINASNRMDRLIQDVLSYSKLARTEISAEPVDVEKLIRNIIHEYPALHAANVQIEVATPLPRLMAPLALLSQCLSNLLDNAVKFIPEGASARVRVWAETSGADVRLWVEDNGIGIAPEYLNRIFGVFERIPGEKTYPGTGIGLAIVRKAATRMGGSAGVESEPGKGSRFWVFLPGRKI